MPVLRVTTRPPCSDRLTPLHVTVMYILTTITHGIKFSTFSTRNYIIGGHVLELAFCLYIPLFDTTVTGCSDSI